jgi:hypothetical protein
MSIHPGQFLDLAHAKSGNDLDQAMRHATIIRAMRNAIVEQT